LFFHKSAPPITFFVLYHILGQNDTNLGQKNKFHTPKPEKSPAQHQTTIL